MRTTTDLPARATADAHRVTLGIDGYSQSGLLLAPEHGPVRALVVAVHGGGVNARYFHGPAHPDVSLLRIGADLGFSVLALDRPGYGPHGESHPEGMALTEQAEHLGKVLAHLRDHHDVGAGIFLLAHSFGGKVALLRAADERDGKLLGLDVSGLGHRHAAPPDGMRDSRGRWTRSWGELGLYPPGTFQQGAAMFSRMPAREAADFAVWPELFDEVAGHIRAPVRLTFAEHESWWRHDEETLADLTARLSASSLVLVDWQPGAGHNISLGWAARAYHLRALAFAEACLTMHRN